MFGMDLDTYDKNYSVLNPMEDLPPKVFKFILPLIIEDVLNGIDNIQCKIHNLRLTGNYIYKEIENKLGWLKIDDDNEPSDDDYYSKKSFCNFEETRLNVFTGAVGGYRPNCLISYVYNGSKSLSSLAKKLPNLKISTVEYTIDFMCKNNHKPKKVRNLFFLFRHYIYVRNQNLTKFYDDRENFTYYIGKKKNFKIYERGPDKKKITEKIENVKISKGWLFSYLDRVRLEMTLDKSHLKKFGLQTIQDFTEDCQFSSIVDKAFSFRKFKKPSNLIPDDWQDYRCVSDKTKNSYSGSFQDQYIFLKRNKIISSLGRNTEAATYFNQLMVDIKNRSSIFSKRFKTANRLWMNKQ